jgi:hypothetical protein
VAPPQPPGPFHADDEGGMITGGCTVIFTVEKIAPLETEVTVMVTAPVRERFTLLRVFTHTSLRMKASGPPPPGSVAPVSDELTDRDPV